MIIKAVIDLMYCLLTLVATTAGHNQGTEAYWLTSQGPEAAASYRYLKSFMSDST